jgi:hypothetical protein
MNRLLDEPGERTQLIVPECAMASQPALRGDKRRGGEVTRAHAPGFRGRHDARTLEYSNVFQERRE